MHSSPKDTFSTYYTRNLESPSLAVSIPEGTEFASRDQSSKDIF